MTAIIFATFKVMNKVCIISTLRSHNRDPPIEKQLILFFWPFPQTKVLYNIPKYLNEKGFPLQCETKWNSYYLNILCCAVPSHSVVSSSLRRHGLYSLPASSIHGDSPDKNTGVGCHSLLQGIFPAQGSNPGLWHCRWILYRLYLIGYK